MKITKQELIEIIKEEVERSLDIEEQEGDEDTLNFATGLPNYALDPQGIETRHGRIPYTDEEMIAFFDPMGASFGDGGGIDALAKDDKFQSASKRERLLILKVATKYIKGGSPSLTNIGGDPVVGGLDDEDLKKSEYRKLKRLYKKNHPNLKGMMRKRAAQKARIKKGYEAGKEKAGGFEAGELPAAPSKDTMMTGIPRDDNDIPMINPGLPKNWRELPSDSKERVDYRNWKKTYGGGGSGAKSGSKMSPKRMRGIMNKADSLVAKVYDQHKNRPEEYTVKRLKNRKSFEHRNLQTALKLYQKAARAGDKRAAKDVATVKKLLQGKFGEVFRAEDAGTYPGGLGRPKDANPSNFRDRSKPFTAKKEPKGTKK